MILTNSVTHSGELAKSRSDIQETLIVGLQVLANEGLGDGVMGHLTARDPEETDHFWTLREGCYWGNATRDDLLLVNPEGKVVKGHGELEVPGYIHHTFIYQCNPEVNASAHAHGKWGTIWASQGGSIAPIDQDSCIFYGDCAVLEYKGRLLEDGMGRSIAAALGDNKALILKNHGISTVGRSIQSTVAWLVLLESVCRKQFLCRDTPKACLVPEDTATKICGQLGGEESGEKAFDVLKQKVFAQRTKAAAAW